MKTKTFECDLEQGYRILCQMACDKTESSDSRRISEITAVIFDNGKCAVGFFKGQVIHLSEFYGENKSLFWECDGHSQSLCDLYCALLDENKVLHEISFGFDGDIFYLDRLWIVPEHRGKKLGLACCAALIGLFSKVCGYAAMKPFPLQWENNDEGSERRFQRDRKKLIAYYGPLGFVSALGNGNEFFYRPVTGEILGFGRNGWRRVKKTTLPSAPEG